MTSYLIYGANGYTGSLIVQMALARGHKPILAGRGESITTLAQQSQLESRRFSLDNPAEIERGLEGVPLVLHCAGPFQHTACPMALACLNKRVHYLDVTGEIGVFESLAALDRQARDAGVMVMPGVGFDVVPTDCLAVHLKRRLPNATSLALGFQGGGRVSRGTATTMAENAHRGGAARIGGVIKGVPACWKTRTIDFGKGPTTAMTIPWGDVSTAWYSTGIPNIEVYLAVPWKVRLFARLSRYLGWLLGSGFVQRRLKKRIQAGPPGPTDEQRARSKTYVWGEARDDKGGCVVSRLQGPEGYTTTALTALAILERVLKGETTPGFQTPGKMYGADFILEIPGFERRDEG
jgi:short subunit dehydrogenase-like uncharacterized protein